MLVSVDRRKVAKISFVIAAMLAAVCAEGAFAGPQTTSDTTKDRLAALETTVAQQAALIAAVQSGLATTNSELAAAKSVTDAVKPLASYLTFDSEDNIYLTGANLHIRSGSGKTDGDVNGLGNLIVGYNENYGYTRTGSHNLVVGPYHNYSSYGGLVAGYKNMISGDYSSVSGGAYGIASGTFSSVSGGGGGIASGNVSSVSGGYGGTASGNASSVSGGLNQTADTGYSYAPYP